MEKRFFILKDLKLNDGTTAKAGSYLTEEHLKEFKPTSILRCARLAMVYDCSGEMEILKGNRDKRRRRIRYLNDIGTDESKKILKILEENEGKIRIVHDERAKLRSQERKKQKAALDKVKEEARDSSSVDDGALSPDEMLPDPPEKKARSNKKGRKK